MSTVNNRRSPIELADLILEYNPGASREMMAHVISEWGGLFDDRQIAVRNAGKTDCVASNGQGSGQPTYCPHLPTATSATRQE
jgi:hypothetical protein